MPVADVGLLCSVTNKQKEMKKLYDAFEKGLTNAYTYDPKDADGDYHAADKHSKLEKIAEKFMTDGVQAVVAVGGIVSLAAAVEAADAVGSDISILYLVGRDSGILHDNIVDGVNLDAKGIMTDNKSRVDAIWNKFFGGDKTKKIGLLINDNSSMGPWEAQNKWDSVNWGPVLNPWPGTGNDKIDFDKIDLTGVAAVVVGGDPYFANKRKALVKRLETIGKPVCYPFETYTEYATSNYIWVGPNLEAAYLELGQKTKAVLDNLAFLAKVKRVKTIAKRRRTAGPKGKARKKK